MKPFLCHSFMSKMSVALVALATIFFSLTPLSANSSRSASRQGDGNGGSAQCSSCPWPTHNNAQRGSCTWPTHTGVDGRAGDFRSGGGADLWGVIRQYGSTIWFIQGGGGYFQSLRTANVGIGQRGMINGCLAYGANVFGDLGITDRSKAFGQVGLGVELFGCSWLARANGYIPLVGAGGTRATGANAFLSGTSAITNFNFAREESYGGFDVEAGYEALLGCGHLWGYAGYFYRDRTHRSAIQGPRIRAEYRLDCGHPFPRVEWIASVEYEYDRIHGHTVSGYGGIRYYIGRCLPPSCCDSPICRYMGRRVWRDPAIWVENQGITNTLINQIIFVDNSTDGTGSQTDPATLANGAAMLQPDGVLFLLQNTGDITALATVSPPDDTQLLGFGDAASRLVVFPSGGFVNVNDLTGAGRATVLAGVSPVVLASNGIFISGWEIDGGGTGISQLAGIGPVLVSDMIFDTVTIAVENIGGGDLTILDSTMLSPAFGVVAMTSPGDILVSGTSIITATIFGIDYDSPTSGGRLDVINSLVVGAVAIQLTDPRVVRVESSTLTGLGVVNAIGLLTGAGAPSSDIRLIDSTISTVIATANGISLSRGTTPGTSHVFVSEGCTWVAPAGSLSSAIVYPIITADPSVTYDDRIRNNTIRLWLDAIDGTFPLEAVDRVDISNNDLTMGLSPSTIVLDNAAGLGSVNVTWNGNTSSTALSIAGTPGSANVGCITLQGNAYPSMTFAMYQAADNKTVFDFSGGTAGLSAANSGTPFVVVGLPPGIAPGPCQLPVIPPAP